MALAFVAVGQAATPPVDEHAAHHPAGVAPAPTVGAAKIDQQMKTMQQMHEKMMAAKTPGERAALMPNHMKAMRDGMAMMGQMRAGMSAGMPMGDMMYRHMEMMETMMQMMMDQQGMQTPAK
ncbi:MAG: hypothetical protein ABIQ86_03810 [Steroidobacteraceae bacterium]